MNAGGFPLTTAFAERKETDGRQPATAHTIGWREAELLRWVKEHADEIERALYALESTGRT